MKKGSAAAKAWGRKMKRLRNKPKRKTSTRRGGVRKTARRAYKKVRKVTRKRKSIKRSRTKNKSMKLGLKIPGIAKKAALGIGGAALATAIISVVMPNSSISKWAAPAGAWALGGIEGVIGSLALNMLGNGSAANTVVVPRLEVL